jgi:hypothetical protein
MPGVCPRGKIPDFLGPDLHPARPSDDVFPSAWPSWLSSTPATTPINGDRGHVHRRSGRLQENSGTTPALADAPDLPILYLLKANALIGMKSTTGADEAARAGLARDPDPDTRTRLLVALARVAKPPENRRLLEEAIALDGNRIAGAMARVILLGRGVN